MTLAHLTATVPPIGLAVNSTTVFTTLPSDGTSSWALYAVPKTAVNSSPVPILTAAGGNSTSGFLGASDSVVFAESGLNTIGGVRLNLVSCDPTNCGSSEQTWYSLINATTACDPSAQECFVEGAGATFSEIQYAQQGTPSQTMPESFSPVLNMASGLSAATGGYLYVAGTYGTTTTSTDAVLQRAAYAGTSGVSTLANLGLSTQFGFGSTLVVTGTRVYVAGSDRTANTTGLISVSLPNGVGNAAPSYLAGTTMSSSSWIAAWGDDTAIYFANAAGQWVTCPASGCTGSPTVLTDATNASPYLVGDAQAIYWIKTTSDPMTGATTGLSIMKIAR